MKKKTHKKRKKVPSDIKKIMKFVILAAIFGISFYTLFSRFAESRVLINTVFITAKCTSFVLNLFGIEATTHAHMVFLDNFSFEVVYECVGIFPIIIFASFVLAYPTKLRNKLIGIAIGVPFIYLFNIFRLIVMALVGNTHPQYFDFLHEYLWQVVVILVIVMLWILWMTKVVKSEREVALSG